MASLCMPGRVWLYTSKADAESVAEGVAFVVMTYLDIDTAGFSVPYIAGWAEDVEVLRRNLAEIQQLAHTIIETIEDAETLSIAA